jgi:hypothetical protein
MLVPALRRRGVHTYEANPVAMMSSWYMVPMRSTKPRNLPRPDRQIISLRKGESTPKTKCWFSPLAVLVAGDDKLVPEGIKLVALVVHDPPEVRVDVAGGQVAPIVVGIIVAAEEGRSVS